MKKKEQPVDHAPIIGMTIMRAEPCRCGCATRRLAFYSTRSKKMVEKCLWCAKRHGAPPKDEINKVMAFVRLYGWNLRPLALCDSGEVRLAY